MRLSEAEEVSPISWAFQSLSTKLSQAEGVPPASWASQLLLLCVQRAQLFEVEKPRSVKHQSEKIQDCATAGLGNQESF